MIWQTEVGTPNQVLGKDHNTAASAENRIEKALINLQTLGARYSHQLQMDCTTALEQVRGTNFKALDMHQWFEWSVVDPTYKTTLVVRVRRTTK